MWSFKVTDPKFSLLNDQQWYPARLLKVEPDELEWQGKPVPKFKFHFAILDPPDCEGREVQGMVNQPTGPELNERHHLYQWITALQGHPPTVGENIDFPDAFLGKIVTLQVKSTKKEYQGREMVFQNIHKISFCANAQDYVNKAPDKMPEGHVPTAPSDVPTTPEPGPTPQPQANTGTTAPQETPPTGAAGEGNSTVVVDGEEIDLPF